MKCASGDAVGSGKRAVEEEGGEEGLEGECALNNMTAEGEGGSLWEVEEGESGEEIDNGEFAGH